MLTRIELTDIGPFPHWEADCNSPQLLITGDNGNGKTTVRRVFACMLDDHNTDLIRTGAEEGIICLEFRVNWDPETGEIRPDGSDTGIIRTRQRVRVGGSKYEIELPNGVKVLKSQKEFLKTLVTGATLDPLKFVGGSDKERLEYLLTVLPVTVTREEIAAVTGDAIRLAGSYDLEGLDNLIATLEANRSEQNAKLKATKGLLTKLEQNLPPRPVDAVDWSEKEKSLRIELRGLEKEFMDAEKAVDAAIRETRELLRNRRAEAINKLGVEEAAEIERVRAEYREKREHEERTHAADLDALSETVESERVSRLVPLESELRAMTTAVAVAGTNASQYLRDEAQRQHVEEARASLRAETQEATRRQKIVEGLRELRTGKVADLGIEGITIRDGVIYVDGKNYKTQLNETEQKKVAIEIAARALRQQPVRMMVMEAGDMSLKHLDWVMEGASAAGIQVFLTKTVPGQSGVRVIPYAEWRTVAA